MCPKFCTGYFASLLHICYVILWLWNKCAAIKVLACMSWILGSVTQNGYKEYIASKQNSLYNSHPKILNHPQNSLSQESGKADHHCAANADTSVLTNKLYIYIYRLIF